MSPDEALICLERAQSNLAAVVEDLVAMERDPVECASHLQRVAGSMLELERTASASLDNRTLPPVLYKISASAAAVMRLFDSAASFYYGRMSTGIRSESEYMPNGESMPVLRSPVLQLEA